MQFDICYPNSLLFYRNNVIMRALSFQRLIYRGYMLLVFLLFMDSMYPWYMWENNLTIITSLLTAFFSVILFVFDKNKIALTDVKIGLVLCITAALLWHYIVSAGLSLILYYVSWIVLILLKDEYKCKLLQFITKWFAVLLLISLLFYIAFLFGISTSPSFIEYQGRYPTLNYYFFTLPIDQFEFYRFKSIFMEPGHLTMGLVPLILANRFDLKNKYVLILFVVELFSFSLAGYITLFIGYLLMNFSFQRMKYLFIGAAFIAVSLFVLERNGFSEMLDNFLWDRLEYKDGNIAGNNRTSLEFDMVYKSVMNSTDKWTGRNDVDVLAFGGNSGYKKYIVTDGIIGLVLALAIYLYQFVVYKKYLVGVFTLILLLLLFQNAYPFWFAVMSMYILGTCNLKRSVHEKSNILSSTQRFHR